MPPAPQGALPTPISPDELARAGELIQRVSTAFGATVVGQQSLLTAMLVTLVSGGHILLESVPGLAKTTAARTLAESVQATFGRIQCTPDLLPSDIVGTQIYDNTKGVFETRLGPVHAHFVLLDEINRSSAKTQSAMLEAMQERQTSIGGTVYPLPRPFMVLATQNPIEQEGTYVLPEAQMDRFLLKEVLTYPTPVEEVEVLRRAAAGELDSSASPTVVSVTDIIFLQELARRVYIDASLQSYIVALINATRDAAPLIGEQRARYIELGASPRGAMALQSAARALALFAGRGHVIPEDIKQLRHSTLRHRIMLTFEAVADDVQAESLIDEIFARVPAP